MTFSPAPFPKKNLIRFLGAIFLIISLFPALPFNQQNVAQAKPLQVPAPTVSVNAPSQMMIGEDFAFTVTFDNAGADPGYGPFIDVVFPTQGADGIFGDPALPADGIAYLSGGSYAGINLTCDTQTFNSSGEIAHPYFRNTSGDYVTVTGTPGDTFVSCLLPFGSVVPEQPPVDVTFQASLSELADAGTPLPIRALGGFIFGADPLNNWCCDDALPSPYPGNSSGWTSQADVTPTVLTLNKSYSGPENETATGPNFPHQFTVTVDVAEGQTVEDFVLQDVLPENLQFVSLDDVSGNGYTTITDLSTPPTSTPGGTLSREFDQIVGTAGGDDASLTFTFYIPRDDADSNRVIDPDSGDDVTSLNNAQGAGTWVPIDPKDDPGTVTGGSTGPPAEYTITDKSIAIQKSVSNPTPPNSPDDILEYTYSIQISDYFAFQDLEISDLISDGQHVLPASEYVPQLTVSGNGNYSLGPVDFTPGNYDVSCNYSGTQGTECTIDDPAADNGETTLELRISDELVSQGRLDGKLLGGCLPTSGGTADCTAQNDGATTITITYQTEILQDFVDDFPSGDPSVDQGDVFSNQVIITGSVLDNNTLLPTTLFEEDGSQAGLSIGRHDPEKYIYAINGSTSLSTPVEVQPGDELTFQVAYDLVTSDVEDLYFTDFLPLPVLSVDDFNADGTGGDTWAWTTGADGKCANLAAAEEITPGVPQSGIVCFGPTDTFYDYTDPPGIIPTIDVDVPANAIEFTYGDFDDPRDQPTRIDILFTVTVNNQPYADGLFFTNQAQVHEGSTNSGNQFTDTIVDFILREPFLVLDKGAVASDNPNAVFDPDPPAPLTFTAPGSPGQRWSGIISSLALDSTPISSAVSNVDGGDLVSFALVIENEGGGSNGAYDIRVSDQLPYGFSIPSSGLNLSIYRGDETEVDFIPLDASANQDPAGDATNLFTHGLELLDPGNPTDTEGICQEYDENDGENIIILTYDLVADDDIAPSSEHENLGTLFNYANTQDGPDFTGSDADLTAETTVTTAAPEINKQLTGSELDDSFNAADETVIGELVTYQLEVTIPEGESPNTVIVDTLDSGLAFVQQDSFTNSNSSDVSVSGSTDPVITDSGQTITWDLGTVANTNRDNITAETLTFEYKAVVLNVVGNQTGTALDNSAVLSWDSTDAEGSAVPSLESPVSAEAVAVIEPILTTSKSVSPPSADAGDTVTFSVTLVNPASGSTTAYDVSWSDTLPADLTYAAGTLAVGACDIAPDSTSDAGPFTADWTEIDPGQSCTLTFEATVDYTVTPGQLITNTAETTWSSLSGDVTDRSTYNTDSDERTGADGVGGALNDYASEDDAQLDVDTTAHFKYLVVTSEDHTGDPGDGIQRVTIGEIVRYRLVVTLPEGTSQNFQVRDFLPPGETFLNDGTAKAIFVSDGAGITSSDFGSLPVPGISDGDCFLTGSSADGSSPAIPSTCDPLPDDNVASSSSTTTDSDTYNTSTDPFFKLGTLFNNDSDADGEYVVVEFNALVDNNSTNPNDAGDLRSNFFRVYINGVQIGANSNTVSVRIAEPLLTVTKTLFSVPADGNDALQYTLVISNPETGNNDGTAFDVGVSDAFDAFITGLSLDSVTTTQGGTCSGGTAYSDSGLASLTASNLSFSASCLDTGQTITLVLSGTLDANIPAGYNLQNLARLTWTSLPGDFGTSPNGTGSTTPGAAGSGTGERDDSGGVNDYSDSDNANRTLDAPLISKTVSPAAYTIGDLFTYNLVVTLPEGVTQDLVLVDDIPVGLEYDSHSVITSAAASGGLLSADYNGVFTNDPPNANSPSGSGTDLTLNFGNTDTDANNNSTDDSFLVEVNVRVLDVSGNYDSIVRTNQGRIEYTNPNTGGTSTVSDTADIAIIEPWITTIKSVSPVSSVQAGDVLTYTVTFTNSGNSPAYEISALDTLAQGVVFTSLTSCTAPATVTDLGSTVAFEGNPAGSWDLAAGGSIECTYTATAGTDLYMNGPHTNTVDADWSSQNGSVSGERVYDDSGSSPVDDDRDEDDAVFNSDAPTLSKDDGAVTQVVIGDTITFTLTIGGELGTYRDLVIADQLPAGLIYNDDASISGFAAAPTETFTTPNDGSAPVTITWDFGDVYKNASSAEISYTARVADVSGNIEGHDLINNVTLDHTRADGSAAAQLDDSDTSQVAEAEITTTKTASPATGVEAGDTVTYTTRFANSGSATAYEVTAEDLLPADVDYNSDASCEYFDGSTISPIAVSVSGTTTLNFGTWDIPVSHYVECEYSISTQADIPLGASHENTVDADWSSQDGTIPGERTYDDGVTGTVDDGVQDEDSSSFTTGSPTTLNKDDGGVTQVAIGDLIHITLTIQTPLGTLRDTTVEDVLPAGMIYVSGSQTVSSNISAASFSASSPNDGSAPVTLTWDFGDASVTGSPVVIEYDARAANVAGNVDATNLINEVTLSYTDDGGPQSFTDTDNVVVIEPLLVVAKSASSTDPALGETVTFTLGISHDPGSTADAYDLYLEDAVPVGYTYVPGSLTHSGGASPDQLLDSTAPTLSAAWDTFPLGSSSTLTYQAELNSDLTPGDDLTNTAVLTWTSQSGPDGNERDGSGGINDYRSEDAVTSTTTNADLRATKDDGLTEYIPGTSQTYDIWVYNDGNGDVSGALVSDSIPSQVETWTWVCAQELGGATGCAGAAATALDFGDFVDLPAGASIRYQVTVQTYSSATGPLTNTVEIEMPSGVIDPTPGNNQDSDTDTQNSQVDLSITKDDGLTVIAPGATLTYTVVAANAGPSDALGVEIEDVLPAGITTWDWACTGATGGADQCTGVSGSSADFSDTIDLPAGSTLTYTVTAQVSSSASGSLTNTVIITPPTGVTDSDLTNNTASDTDLFAEHSKVLTSTNQTFTTSPEVAIGEILTYQITLSVPPGEMVDLTLTDQLEQGLAYLDCQSISAASLSTSVPGGFDQVCSSPAVSALPGGSAADEDQGRQVVFSFGTLSNASGDELDLVITYRTVVLNNLANQSGVSLNNQAGWNWTGGSLSDSADQVTLREPDLTFRKSVSPRSAFPGQTVTFSIIVEHTGISETPAYDATLTDTIPAGLTYVPGTLQHDSGQTPDTLDDSTAPDLTVIWDEFLNNGQESVISFQVTLDGTLRRGDRVENTAALSWTSLPGDVSSPQSAFNVLSTERFYDPGSAVNVYGLEASATIRVPALPETGFAPGVVTDLPQKPSDQPYAALEDLQLEIPLLDLSLPIVSVPQNNQGWDLTWLWQEAGWLEGTAFPTWQGNTALTAHAYLASGAPGPFVDLGELSWGDELQIISHGQVYTYQVREKKYVSGDDLSILGSQERDWLTLFTCQEYSEQLEGYRWRLVVQAVLIEVDPVE